MYFTHVDICVPIFWALFGAIFYSYAGYPFVLALLARFFQNPVRTNSRFDSERTPMVSVIIAAYNEERIIEDKIRNTLALHYPPGRLEIVVMSDGSQDSTNEIVSRYVDQGVVLQYYPDRLGKTECLNRTVPLAKGEIVVLTDANAMFDEQALLHLVRNFEDHTVGFVTGFTKYRDPGAAEQGSPINLYTRLEILKKELESSISSCVGADGAILALRKGLYPALTSRDINDFVIPLAIIEKGFRGIFERNAFCYEASQDSAGEFERQIRITARTLLAIVKYRKLLNPLRFGFFSFALASNKLMKFISAGLLVVFFLVNAALAFGPAKEYLLLFAGHFLFYAIGIVPSRWYPFKSIARIAGVSRTFLLTNLAILIGWYQYFTGKAFVTWKPIR